ncbi:MAG: hypothetical protein WCP36_08875 [Methanomicrobiales archaeon]
MSPENIDKVLSNPEHDTEDKGYWTKKYFSKETEFCERIAPLLKVPAEINPEKEKSPFKPDLIVNNKLADLKYQSTPFYSAGHNYGYDPQYTVTFNEKDYLNYSKNYPEIEIFYWVDYQPAIKEHRGAIIKLMRFEGIFNASLCELDQIIKTKKSPLHNYQRRTNDNAGNAKASYLLDVRDLHCLLLLEGAIM